MQLEYEIYLLQFTHVVFFSILFSLIMWKSCLFTKGILNSGPTTFKKIPTTTKTFSSLRHFIGDNKCRNGVLIFFLLERNS